MYGHILLVLLSIIGATKSSNIEILNSPKSLIFRNTSDALSSEDLALFLNQCLGYTTMKPKWNGFYGYKNIGRKNIPRNIVLFHLPITLKAIASHTFPMSIDSNLLHQFDYTKQTMMKQAKNNENLLAEFIDLSSKNKNTDLSSQLDLIEKYLNQMDPSDDRPVFLWFEAFSNQNNLNVMDKLSKIIEHVENLFGPHNTLIVSIFDENQSILERTIRQTNGQNDVHHLEYNLAHEYDADFHSSFVTIGFASLLFILAVFVIAVSMWNIDPGRDSIIFRLTAQKIKKEQ